MKCWNPLLKGGGVKNVLKTSLFEMPSGFFPEDLGKINDEH